MAVERNFELRPHKAIDRTGQEVTFAQDQIFLNGVRIGYVGHALGESASLIRPVDKETGEELKKFIAAARGGVTPSALFKAPVIEDVSDDE